MTRSIRRKRMSAFTLVELLVVIAIIAILGSMLLPAIISAKSKAMAVRCGANLRGNGTALLAYASEWNGYIPPNGVEDLPSYLTYSVRGLDVVYPTPGPPNTLHPCDLRGLGDYLGNARSMMCPGFLNGAWITQTNALAYWYPWYGQNISAWKNEPLLPEGGPPTYYGSGGHFIGYNYIKSNSLFGWYQRYGGYGTVLSLKTDNSYPLGAMPLNFRNMILLSDYAYDTGFGAWWFIPFQSTLSTTRWDNFPHDPYKPRGGNALWGDGSVTWAGLDGWNPAYNGWAFMDSGRITAP